jgi:hypothetical protein
MKISTLMFFILVANVLFAQQDPLHSQYMLNPLLINPAYAGLNNNFNGMAGYRIQWTGLEGHPQTMHASAHTSLVNNKIGAGILFLNDRAGSISNTETNVSVSYKLDLGKRTFSFGMQARNLNTYGVLVQTLIRDQYRFGYVFELPTNKSVGTKFATHEICLGVLLSVFSYHERFPDNF